MREYVINFGTKIDHWRLVFTGGELHALHKPICSGLCYWVCSSVADQSSDTFNCTVDCPCWRSLCIRHNWPYCKSSKSLREGWWNRWRGNSLKFKKICWTFLYIINQIVSCLRKKNCILLPMVWYLVCWQSWLKNDNNTLFIYSPALNYKIIFKNLFVFL